MPAISRLGALRVYDRDKWVKTIRKAMENANGRIPDAAEALEIGQRQLFRWLQDPEFSDVPRVEVGETRPGNPRGRKLGSKNPPKEPARVIPIRRQRNEMAPPPRILTRRERRALDGL